MKSLKTLKKVLWLSPYAPYDQVAHAGGKVHNYYLKQFHKSGLFDITLLSLCDQSEAAKLDLDAYGIKNRIHVAEKNQLDHLWRYFLNGISHVNPFDPYDGVALLYERIQLKRLLQAYIREQKKAQTAPDIVILQWTFALMLLPEVKKAFPACRTVAVEEDVTFQSYERIWRAKSDNSILEAFWRHRFHREKRRELALLRRTDLIVTNNQKDTELLQKNGIEKEKENEVDEVEKENGKDKRIEKVKIKRREKEIEKIKEIGKIFSAVPYYDDYSTITRCPNEQDRTILFYGAMSRAENFESAIWFIEKVMPLLETEKVRFVIVGANPPERLLRLQSERVEVTGYVQDVRPYFSACLCMALPLLRGAGIKIKVLEGLSAGIPVLTNEVGIEGIGAAPGREYLHCTTPEEYAEVVKKMSYGTINIAFLEKNARSFMKKNYNAEAKVQEFIACVNKL